MDGPRLEVLRHQLHIAWSLTELVVDGLTDRECHWSPAPAAWGVRRAEDGDWYPDWVEPEPDPPPVTTIGWLTWHIDMWWSMVYDHAFGAGALQPGKIRWAGDATAAVARVQQLHEQWATALATLSEGELDAADRTGWPFPAGSPFAQVVGWVNVELMKNAAEIGQLRRIYRHRDPAAPLEDHQ
ncbi:DinB family protein [Natronosporangium hydrolyticum]|uniref:DinB family protein n=1 Tax=Natronosporangium hydrolyticum TaxID=2811111 RepID=A0A895Y8K1_9ACTN|nr:DinB family protein [Natronosporangium hydrolyticum]QSB14064.1 DinB family protein [Natronosporangium hydrolyticum]